MKHILTATAMLAAVALIAGCGPIVIPNGGVTGSGRLETRTFDLTGFTRVDVSSAIQLDVTRADAFAVSVKADDNLWDRITVRKDGDTLRISMEGGFSFFNTTVRATVSMPSLSGLTVSGASRATIAGFSSADAFQASATGAGSVKGSITCGDMTLMVSGASNTTLTGAARNVKAEVSGASHVDLSGVTAANADVTVSGASNATVNVTGRLDATASGASSVRYLGNPTLGRQNSSGASSIRHQ